MLSPLLYKQILNAKSSLQIVANWEQVLGQANLKNLILIPIKFVSGRISFYPKALYYLIAGGWSVIVWFFVFTGGLKKKAFLFLLFAPLVLGLLFSFFTPFFSYFRFIYLIPVMTILIAAGAKTPVNRLIIAVGMIGFSLVYLLNSNYYREDWKNLAKNLPKNELIYIIPSSADPLKYYRNNLSLINLTNFETDHNRQAFLISQQIKKMTVIPYAADIYGIEYKKILTTNRFALNNIKTFRGLTIESWIRSDL